LSRPNPAPRADFSALLSEVPGAAEHLQGGFVTYTKANKIKSLAVEEGFYIVEKGEAVLVIDGVPSDPPARNWS
jgi:hypothetical protein